MKDGTVEESNTYRSKGLIISYFISIYFAAIMLYSGVEQVIRGEPLQAWAAEVTLGILIVISIVAIGLFSLFQKSSPSKTDFGLFDWLLLLICGSYMATGVLLYMFGFYYRRLEGAGVLLFAFLGFIGVLGLLHKKFRSDK